MYHSFLIHSSADGHLGCFHLFQNFPQFIVIHTVKGFGIVNKAEIDIFVELCCFFDDPVDVSNLISGSSAFSKTILDIRKFTVHILLKPGLENFEPYFTSVWDDSSYYMDTAINFLSEETLMEFLLKLAKSQKSPCHYLYSPIYWRFWLCSKLKKRNEKC